MSEKLSSQQLTTWRFFITLHARLIGKMDKRLHTAGQIPLHWYDVLIELYEAPQQRLRMSELAERVVLTRSGLTRLVDQLEKAGYLERSLDPQDRRGFYAVLTTTGITAMKQAWLVYSTGILELFAQHLTLEENEQFQQLLQRLLSATTTAE